MTAFATKEQLATRLMVDEFTEKQAAAVDALLEDASDHLRHLIGQQITTGTTTFTAQVPAGTGELLLPQQPARSVGAVSVAGTPRPNFQLINGKVHFDRYAGNLDYAPSLAGESGRYGYVDVEITYTHGMTAIPPILRVWTLALASQALAQVEIAGAIGNPGLTSQRLDDFAETYTPGQGSEAWAVPDKTVERLRAQFGHGAYVGGGT